MVGGTGMDGPLLLSASRVRIRFPGPEMSSSATIVRPSITSVEFRNYKAFRHYSLHLQHMNILVGPNNCGKSTLVGAFRALWAALRRARGRGLEMVQGPRGKSYGYWIPAESLPISIENIHSDYAETDTTITFRLSNANQMHLMFPTQGACSLSLELANRRQSTVSIRRDFPIDVAIVPVLGPVEHDEELLLAETIVRYQMTHRAARHFRNRWYHFPEGFDAFAGLVEKTWPGMQIQRPELLGTKQQVLAMFCLERRMTRELYWSGFGFQVWCQLLTHVVGARGSTVFLVDEPEIYLHADLQRQLVSILRELGPDVIMATHSTEIMAEADPSEIILVDKARQSGERLKTVESLQGALEKVGSIQNITLARLAKTRKVLFVEDDYDYLLLRRFAKELGLQVLAAGMELIAVKSGGFSSWEKVSVLGWGLEKALGETLQLGAVYDRDYFCSEEISVVLAELQKTVKIAHVHARKEIENYLLVPDPLERALKAAVEERSRRLGETAQGTDGVIRPLLTSISESQKNEVQSQYVGRRVDYLRKSGKDSSTLVSEALSEFEVKWQKLETRLEVVPGKLMLAELRGGLQKRYCVSLTDYRIISAFKPSDVPSDLSEFLHRLDAFRLASP